LAGVHPGLLTIIAPRHPARGPEIAATLGGAPRRSDGSGPPAGGIWIADTMGELGLWYRLAPLVFMGRSLAGQGGQNPLEPARLGCAVVTGPHTGNFADSVARLRAAGALTVVDGKEALASWVDRMLRDPVGREQAGQAALRVASGDQGLPDRVAEALLELAER
jgi:3-deoxy-D-manno-octulosonic-acid transferase